jgi:hypothetical protein
MMQFCCLSAQKGEPCGFLTTDELSSAQNETTLALDLLAIVLDLIVVTMRGSSVDLPFPCLDGWLLNSDHARSC